LAIASAKRSPLAPDVPTVNEALGIKGFDAVLWNGVAAPAGTPKAVVDLLSDATNKVLKDPQVIEMMNKAGQEPVAMSPEEFAAFLDNEIKKWSKTIQTAGIKPE
jgi:tripartite-type tricarboxylate transporter receptor subunit TctC